MKTSTSMLATVKATVEMYARRYARSARGHLDFDDLCQLGYMAAMKAAESFDPEGGATLATYCRKPVNAAMRNAVAEWRGTMLSLDAPMGASDDGEGSTFLESLAAECGSPEESAEQAERSALVKGIVDKVVADFESHEGMARLLVERLMDGEIVESRFRSDVSLADIAARFGVSRQRVGIIEKDLKAKLAEALAEVA